VFYCRDGGLEHLCTSGPYNCGCISEHPCPCGNCKDPCPPGSQEEIEYNAMIANGTIKANL